MNTIPVIGNRVTLYSYIDRENETRVNVCALLPNEDYNGVRLNVIDWKIDSESGTVLMTYMTRNDAYAPIYDTKFPFVKDVTKLRRPNRSKNWKLDQYSDYWFNFKTGKKSYF